VGSQVRGFVLRIPTGKKSHDAIGKIYNLARPNMRKKIAVDADIKGAFDNICQDFILKAIGDVPGRALIEQWLQAGYLEDGGIMTPNRDAARGRDLSVASEHCAHGMEAALELPTTPGGKSSESVR